MHDAFQFEFASTNFPFEFFIITKILFQVNDVTILYPD